MSSAGLSPTYFYRPPPPAAFPRARRIRGFLVGITVFHDGYMTVRSQALSMQLAPLQLRQYVLSTPQRSRQSRHSGMALTVFSELSLTSPLYCYELFWFLVPETFAPVT